jgi:hypothetical protein
MGLGWLERASVQANDLGEEPGESGSDSGEHSFFE